MRVTPNKRAFGKYKPGDIFELRDRTAKLLIRVGKLSAVGEEMTYQTRMMQAAPVQAAPSVEVDSTGAEWDSALHVSTKLKNSDGTWRKKRAAA